MKDLKTFGKHLFIVSNEEWDWVDVVMRASFGNEWYDLFHVLLARAQKPLFYVSDNPFLTKMKADISQTSWSKAYTDDD